MKKEALRKKKAVAITFLHLFYEVMDLVAKV